MAKENALKMKKAEEAKAAALRVEMLKKQIDEEAKKIEDDANIKTPEGRPSLIRLPLLLMQGVVDKSLASQDSYSRAVEGNKHPKFGDANKLNQDDTLSDYKMQSNKDVPSEIRPKALKADVDINIENEKSSARKNLETATKDQYDNEGTSVDQSAEDKNHTNKGKKEKGKEEKQSGSGWSPISILNRNKSHKYKNVPTSDT